MSTREMACNIFQQLSKKQLQGFIATFKEYFVNIQENEQQELEGHR